MWRVPMIVGRWAMLQRSFGESFCFGQASPYLAPGSDIGKRYALQRGIIIRLRER